MKNHLEAPERRLAQKELASDIVTLVHGEKALKQALKVTDALFSGDFQSLLEEEFLILSKVLESKSFSENAGILDVLVDLKLASSKREARQFVQSGAIQINDEKVIAIDQSLSKEAAFFNQYLIIRRGKKNYALAILK
ncbi:MAG: S4 domain-containing protein, partial [Acholeplasmataceae bacterium]|nr:S4 domain-containing protein [Acholeplasmataceae bacterium]